MGDIVLNEEQKIARAALVGPILGILILPAIAFGIYQQVRFLSVRRRLAAAGDKRSLALGYAGTAITAAQLILVAVILARV